MNLDINEQNILSLTEDKEIVMEVHGKTKTYLPIKEADSSWDLKVVNEENHIYGLSCESFKELRAFLLVDYATGIITKAHLSEPNKLSELSISSTDDLIQEERE